MINPKSCPRCHRGDVFDGSDEYGLYKVCIQCGHLDYPQKPIDLELAKAEQRRRGGRH
jgi:hypothetical protein